MFYNWHQSRKPSQNTSLQPLAHLFVPMARRKLTAVFKIPNASESI